MTHDVRAAAVDATALGAVLTVWAHPDDEAYLAGGLLAALRDAGHRVVCVTATRGEAADPAADAAERAALAAVRTRELEAALGVLGVTEHHWLDLPDGGLAGVDPAGPATGSSALVDEVRPDTVVTFGPDGFTGHTDHRAVSHWTDLGVARSTYGAQARLLHAVTQEHLIDHELVESSTINALGDAAVLYRRGARACDCRCEVPHWSGRWRHCCASAHRPPTWSARSDATGSPHGSPPSASLLHVATR